MALNLGNQTLGRGKIYISQFLSGTHTPAGFRYIGNTPSFNLTVNQSKLDHYSSEAGVRVKDRSIVTQMDIMGNLVLDDINSENLALFFFGAQSVLTQTSATAETQTFANTVQGYAYQLGATAANPTGVRSVTNVVVKVGAATKALGTDYTLDAERGLIFIVEGGGIADAASIIVTYDRPAKSRKQVVSGTTQVEGAIRFEAANPQGAQNDFYMPYVRLSPNGDFGLKTDEWQQLNLMADILADTAYNRAAIYIDGQPY